MPSSDFTQIGPIVELIILSNPTSVLDIGCGFGKYGVLAREYLELWDGRQRYDDWTRRIDAIEVFESCITPLHRFVYNEILIGDALEVLDALVRCYDLALLVDVIEHLDHETGRALIERCLVRCRNVLLATPTSPGVQGAAFGNPAETHRSVWRWEDLMDLPGCFAVPHPHSLICFAGKDARRVRASRLRAKLAREGMPLPPS